jgi:hypothetical protein
MLFPLFRVIYFNKVIDKGELERVIQRNILPQVWIDVIKDNFENVFK